MLVISPVECDTLSAEPPMGRYSTFSPTWYDDDFPVEPDMVIEECVPRVEREVRDGV